MSRFENKYAIPLVKGLTESFILKLEKKSFCYSRPVCTIKQRRVTDLKTFERLNLL